jgi:hypothetical protein
MPYLDLADNSLDMQILVHADDLLVKQHLDQLDDLLHM